MQNAVRPLPAVVAWALNSDHAYGGPDLTGTHTPKLDSFMNPIMHAVLRYYPSNKTACTTAVIDLDQVPLTPPTHTSGLSAEIRFFRHKVMHSQHDSTIVHFLLCSEGIFNTRTATYILKVACLSIVLSCSFPCPNLARTGGV
jgi:hypothetical protein